MTQARFDEAVRLHQARRFDEALRLYRAVLAADPRHVDALHLAGVVAGQSGLREEAVALIGRAIALSPDFALAHFNLGNALRALGRNEAALEAFRSAASLDPRHAPSHSNLGATLRALGRPEEALTAYQAALRFDPAFAEAWYNSGVALAELGRHGEAAEACRRAIRLKPDHADAFANLGGALQAQGKDLEALDAWRRAVALSPDSAGAHTGIASASQALGRFDEALTAAHRAADLAPDDAGAQVLVGLALQGLERNEEAIAAYHRALALDPGHVDALISLAVALQEVGRPAEALSALDRALAANPASARAWFVRSDLKRFAPGDPEIAAMEDVAAQADAGGVALEDRLDMAFALGKAWMDAGDADRAFGRLAEGNRLKRASLRYDVAQDEQRLGALARIFTGDLLRQHERAGAISDLPVLVVGMPRSGTTLVEQILGAHPAVHGAGESMALQAIARQAFPDGGFQRLRQAPPRALAAMGQAYIDLMTRLAPGAARVVDKMPSNFQFLGLAHLILPGARIIHCRRDPVDTCFSCYSRLFAGRQDFAYDLAELGRYYRAYDRLMEHWRGLLPPDRFLDVQYEDVVADLEGQARRMVDFLGLDWSDACLDFAGAGRLVRTASANQVRQPIYRSSIGRWRPYGAYLAPLLDALGESR